MGRKKKRLRQMEHTVSLIQQRWGSHVIRRATQLDTLAEPATLSTGFANINRALGNGGFARGHLSELVGRGTAGQMTLAAKTLHEAQKAGQQIVYVDALQTIDLDFLARCGVALESMVVLRPADLRHAVEMTGDLIRGGGAGAVVLDRLHPSLAGTDALQALMNVLPEWNAILSHTLCTLLILSETILPDAYPYGPTLPHFAHARLGFQWQHWTYRKRRCTGFVSQVTVLKNRSGPSGVSRLIEVMLRNGIHGVGQ
jgi:recombination protein RecA